MDKIKITINNENRIAIIPMDYDPEKDEAHINEIQIEPIPDKDEDISKDVVLQLTKLILTVLRNG